jgi:hypothetical protein
VAPELVAEVRSQTEGRRRPWTADELDRLAISIAAPQAAGATDAGG